MSCIANVLNGINEFKLIPVLLFFVQNPKVQSYGVAAKINSKTCLDIVFLITHILDFQG